MSALLAPAISLAGLTAYRTVPINWDSAILLDCGRQILQGAVPYVDYVESNPPLSHYLHTLPVLLARWTGLGLPDAFQWWTLGLTACSAAALWMILGRDPLLGRSYKHRGIVVGAWVCFSLSLLATDDFGQREHLFMLGFAPWLLFRLQFCDEPTRHWRLALVAAGLLAPLALLKPYFAALIVVIEAWLVLRTRRWSDLLRLDLLIMSLVGLAYAAHFLLVPAAMREAFFG